jgi:hypothetical protein
MGYARGRLEYQEDSTMTVQLHRDFYDVASLAEALGLAEQVVGGLAETGELPARKVAGKYIFSAPVLHEWLRSPSSAASIPRQVVPHGEPSEEFLARLDSQVERYGPLLERLAHE